MAKPTNETIADTLERIADLLEADDSNPFRVRAYREGAGTIRRHDKPAAKLEHEELKELPHIGDGIASVIGELVSAGKSSLLEDLESNGSPDFDQVPGIGKELNKRIVNHLHIRTLPELEQAAHDGRLQKIEGFGAKRIEGIQEALAGMLNRSARSKQPTHATNGTSNGKKADSKTPSVELLLDIDTEYRKKAKAGDLHMIAPRRFNPEKKAWLPLMHTRRDGWDFTVMFSNTQQAHKLEKTDDWVVVYFEKDGTEDQHTIVTETRGSLKGKRVVRGRESESRTKPKAVAKSSTKQRAKATA
jgi:hypothetical protein